MRIKSRWNKRATPKSSEEIAKALSYIGWQIASNGVLEIENQGYITDSNAHRLELVGEYLAFLLHVSDRLCYSKMEQTDRQIFITALANCMTHTFVDNKRDLLGKGEYHADFVSFLNQRSQEYAEFDFTYGKPGFHFLRHFGEKIALVLKGERWATEYIMEIGGVEAAANLKKSMQGLFSQQPVSQME